MVAVIAHPLSIVLGISMMAPGDGLLGSAPLLFRVWVRWFNLFHNRLVPNYPEDRRVSTLQFLLEFQVVDKLLLVIFKPFHFLPH